MAPNSDASVKMGYKGLRLNRNQMAFFRAVDACVHGSDWDSVLYSSGTGGGKSYAGAVASYQCIAHYYPGKKGCILAQKYDLATRVNIPALQVIMTAAGLKEGEHYIIRKAPYRIEYVNGTVVDILSAEHPGRIVGDEYAWAWVDEPGGMKEDVWARLAGRMRAAERTVVFLTGTPEGMNWVHDLHLKPTTKTIFGSSYDNLRNVGQAYIDRILGVYDEKQAQAWIQGQFVDLTAHRAYSGFDDSIHVATEPMPFHPVYPVELCVDFNIAPLVWVLAQEIGGRLVVPDNGVVTIATDASTQVACAMVKKRLADAGLRSPQIRVYGDASGSHRDTRSGSDDYAIIRGQLPGAMMMVPQGNPPVRARVNAVNAAFIGGKIIIGNKGNQALIDDLNRVAWRDTSGTDLDKRNGDLTHATDALGYLIVKRFPVDVRKPYSRSG